MEEKSQVKSRPYLEVFSVTAILILIIALRVFLYKSREFDEGIYLLVSKMANEGFNVYKDLWFDKPPIIFLFTQVGFKLFGTSLWSATAWYSMMTIFASFLVYSAVSIVFKEKSRKLAVFSSLLFLFFTSLPLSELFWIMTEIYLIIFELLTIIFLFKGLQLGEKAQKVSMLLSGFFLFVTFMIRPTGAIFILATIIFFFAVKKATGLRWFAAGFVISGALFIYCIAKFYNIHDFIYQVFVGQYEFRDQAKWSVVPVKFVWLKNYFFSTMPLWVLTIASLPSLVHRSFRRNAWFIMLGLWLVLTILFYAYFDFAPGFGHEYSETIAPLSIFAIFGIKFTLEKFRTNKIFSSAVIIATIFALALSFRFNYKFGEWRSDDLTTLNEISSYYKNNIKPEDNLFVLETRQLKIGPWIYFMTKSPSIIHQRLAFTMPIRELKQDEADTLILKFEEKKLNNVIIVGGPPPQFDDFGPINSLYSYLMANFKEVKTFSPYSPFPGRVENLPVKLYSRVKFDDLKTSQIISPDDIVGVDKIIKDEKVEVAYTPIDWFTVNYVLKDSIDLNNMAIKLNILGSLKKQKIMIDLVDDKNRFSRHSFEYPQGWQQIKTWVSNESFPSSNDSSTNLSRIKQIHIVIPKDNSSKIVQLGQLTILE